MSHIDRVPGSPGGSDIPTPPGGRSPDAARGAGRPTHDDPSAALAGLPVLARSSAGRASFVNSKTAAEQKAFAEKLSTDADGIEGLSPGRAAVEFDRILRATDDISAEYAAQPLRRLAAQIGMLPSTKRSQAFDAVFDKAEKSFSAGRISSEDYGKALTNLALAHPSLPEGRHAAAAHRLFGQISRLPAREQNLPLAMVAAGIPRLSPEMRYPAFRVVLTSVNKNGSGSPFKAQALYGLAASPQFLPEGVRSAAFLEASHGIKTLSLDEQEQGLGLLWGQFSHLPLAGQAPALHSMLDTPLLSPSNVSTRGVPPSLSMFLPKSIVLGANLSPEHRFFVLDKAADSITALPKYQQGLPVYALAAHAKSLPQPAERATVLRKVINSEALSYNNIAHGVSDELYTAMLESASQISSLKPADRFDVFANLGRCLYELPEKDRPKLYAVLESQFHSLGWRDKAAVRNFVIRRAASDSIRGGADVQAAVQPYRKINRQTTNYLHALAAVHQGVPPDIAAQQFRVTGQLLDELRKEAAGAGAAGSPPSI